MRSPELYPFLREVTAECSRDEASTARLVFETQRDEHGRWTVQDRGLLAPWKRIVIEAAFGQHTEELFRGFIREIVADYPNESGASTVTVECQDASLALDREHVRQAWGVDAPTTDGEIVTKIASLHRLTFATKPGPGLSNLTLYQNSTDIRFLRARAEANGYELYFRAGDIYFGPMQLDAHPQPTIMVYAGLDTNCLSLSVTSDGHLPNKVAFDLAPGAGTEITRKEIVPRLVSLGTEPADAGGDGLKDFTWLLSHEGSFDEDELTARAQGRVNDSRCASAPRANSTARCTVTCCCRACRLRSMAPATGSAVCTTSTGSVTGSTSTATASKSACSATPMATTSTQAPAWAAWQGSCDVGQRRSDHRSGPPGPGTSTTASTGASSRATRTPISSAACSCASRRCWAPW